MTSALAQARLRTAGDSGLAGLLEQISNNFALAKDGVLSSCSPLCTASAEFFLLASAHQATVSETVIANTANLSVRRT